MSATAKHKDMESHAVGECPCRSIAGGGYSAWRLDGDPPPTKWSDLRYVFEIKEDCNGKEAIQA